MLRTSGDAKEARLANAADHDLFEEHRVRAHPPAAVVVERPVHHQRLVRLAVARNGDHLVLAALVVTIAAQRRKGQGRQAADRSGFVLRTAAVALGIGRRAHCLFHRTRASSSLYCGSFVLMARHSLPRGRTGKWLIATNTAAESRAGVAKEEAGCARLAWWTARARRTDVRTRARMPTLSGCAGGASTPGLPNV